MFDEWFEILAPDTEWEDVVEPAPRPDSLSLARADHVDRNRCTRSPRGRNLVVL